jgi:hypothetical protein
VSKPGDLHGVARKLSFRASWSHGGVRGN